MLGERAPKSSCQWHPEKFWKDSKTKQPGADTTGPARVLQIPDWNKDQRYLVAERGLTFQVNASLELEGDLQQQPVPLVLQHWLKWSIQPCRGTIGKQRPMSMSRQDQVREKHSTWYLSHKKGRCLQQMLVPIPKALRSPLMDELADNFRFSLLAMNQTLHSHTGSS